MDRGEVNHPGGEASAAKPSGGGPSASGDPDSLVDVDSPDDEYWPEPLTDAWRWSPRRVRRDRKGRPVSGESR